MWVDSPSGYSLAMITVSKQSPSQMDASKSHNLSGKRPTRMIPSRTNNNENTRRPSGSFPINKI